MLPFSFEDRHPGYDAGTGYGVTNEEPSILRDFMKPFRKGLGIAAAGEAHFLATLPKVHESLTLIDHSYGSLRSFCIKALWLTIFGPEATRKLFVEGTNEARQAAIRAVEADLPECLRLATPRTGAGTYFSCYLQGNSPDLRREWYYADLPSLKRATANLHKVRLIHGDLLDTGDGAPYDFLYLSNAQEHVGRHRRGPSIEAISAMLTKRAPIVWVETTGYRSGTSDVAHRRWSGTASVKGYRTTWIYHRSFNTTQPQQVGAVSL